MANFATLADVAGRLCVQAVADACGKLFAAATPPTQGGVPTDTLTAAEAIASTPGTSPGDSSPCSTQFYPCRQRQDRCAQVPYMPYLIWAPSAWVLPLKFDGGGYRAGGKAMFDSHGNLWVGDNFTIGWQGQDALWQGQREQVRPQRQPALADHDRLHRRRHGRRHVRRGRGRARTTRGSPPTAAIRSPCSTRTESR